MPGEVLRIQGVLSQKDLFGANKLMGKERPSDALSVASLFLFLFLATFGAAITSHFALMILAALFLALATGFGYAGFRLVRRVDRYWRQQRGVFRFRQIEITEKGIRQQTKNSSAAYQWNVFAKYAATKRLVILHFDPPDGQMYYCAGGCLIIPREFFLSDTDWDRFVRLVRGKLPKKYRGRRR